MRFLVFTALMFCALPSANAAIYKCTSETGKVALQDKPCPGLGPESYQETPAIADDVSDKVKVSVIDIAQGATYLVGLPKSWRGETGTKSEITTFVAKPDSGEATTLLISFFPNELWGDSPATAFANFMTATLGRHLKDSKETIIKSIDVNPTLLDKAAGRLVLFYDEELDGIADRGEGEFVYTWTGAIATPRFLIYISILTDKPDSENTIFALIAAQSIADDL